MRICEEIRTIRKSIGSLSLAAEVTGISPETLRTAESGRYVPTDDTIERLALAAGTPIDVVRQLKTAAAGERRTAGFKRAMAASDKLNILASTLRIKVERILLSKMIQVPDTVLNEVQTAILQVLIEERHNVARKVARRA